MNLLAFDTSTDTLSLALAWDREGGALQEVERSGPGGAQASATLIPLALEVLAGAGLTVAALDAVVFGSGPGSFTGLRTACAVAQGLAFGSGRPVLPVETLMAVAEQARCEGSGDRVLAVLDARMDEVYAAAYLHDGHAWQRQGPIMLCAPQRLQMPAGFVLAGNAFAAYGERLPAGVPRHEARPTAGALLRLAPGLIASGQAVAAELAMPLYIRDKVAQTTDERAALRAAHATHAPIR